MARTSIIIPPLFCSPCAICHTRHFIVVLYGVDMCGLHHNGIIFLYKASRAYYYVHALHFL